ncbi:carboxymuconolactone decarboxylase family protein (plasmid) [Sphingomonas paeninsulae]|uniref:Carboxymuconolactone decarboxylase family protein n=1 Tax=Sphingomonas paeninsulae TaxID=2319844 RepID=A0A494TH58_SPHPE|nr:carboxymuconolactone decarboxylase family protein [Sphingomonas paeninsulae]AYJ85151.1 carboxymuconolactone decarboxylase family protein [Sphingomonas paeninsulae]
MRVDVHIDHIMEPTAYVASTYAREIVGAAFTFSKVTYEHTRLSLREFEAARARTAQINGCLLCQTWRADRDTAAYLESMGSATESVATRGGDAPDETFYDQIGDWRDSTQFSERERVAIEYADGLGLNPHGIADNEPFWARMKAAYSDDEIVDLSYCIACWMGLGRVAHVLGIDGVCQIPALARLPVAA